MRQAPALRLRFHFASSLFLSFLADLDKVALGVANFKELRIAAILNRPGENTVTSEMVMPFLQLAAENNRCNR